jgi:hypothetical protein
MERGLSREVQDLKTFGSICEGIMLAYTCLQSADFLSSARQGFKKGVMEKFRGGNL